MRRQTSLERDGVVLKRAGSKASQVLDTRLMLVVIEISRTPYSSHADNISKLKSLQWRSIHVCLGIMMPNLSDWWNNWVAVISAKNHKSQRRKRQSVTTKRGKSQTPKVLTAILTIPTRQLPLATWSPPVPQPTLPAASWPRQASSQRHDRCKASADSTGRNCCCSRSVRSFSVSLVCAFSRNSPLTNIIRRLCSAFQP